MKNISTIFASFAALSLIFPLYAQENAANIKETSQALIKELRNYNVHSYRDDVIKKVPPALEFIEANKGDLANRALVIDVAVQTLTTAKDGGDNKLASSAADFILADELPKQHDWRKAVFRLRALDYKARSLVDEKKFKEAIALFDDLRKFDPTIMTPSMRASLTEKIVNIMMLEGSIDPALAFIENEAKTFDGDDYAKNDHARRQALEAINLFRKVHRYEDAFKYCRQKNMKSEALKLISDGCYGDVAAGKTIATELIADETEPISNRMAAWDWLYGREPDFASKWLPALLVEGKENAVNNIRNFLSYKLVRGNFMNVYGQETPAYFSNNDETIRVWNDYLMLSNLARQKVGFTEAQYAIVAYGAKADFAKAAEIAHLALENEKLKPEEVYELELAKRALPLTGSAEEIQAKIKEIDNEIGKSIAPDKRLANLSRVGAIAVASKNDALARAFVNYRAEVKPDYAKKVYNVEFSQKPILGAHNWEKLSTKAEKQPLDRPFGGGDMSFMLTDVSTGDRGNATKRNDETKNTLQIAADEWGLHFLFTVKDPRAREIEAGFIDAGSYECYIAPGAEQPYTCFMPSTKKDRETGLWHTTYNTPGHRRVDGKDLNRFKYETVFHDDEILNYTGFSWDNFISLIPNKSSKWEFECVYWGAKAAAWNGTLSVHGRSSWGTLTFNISDKDRAQIYRKLLFKVVENYKSEKLANPKDPADPQGGILEYWQDPSLGDPEFYNEKVLPIVEKLDEVVARITVDISDKDVIEITENYLSEFLNLRFTISRLRAEYVKSAL